jgi:hypothetical protein
MPIQSTYDAFNPQSQTVAPGGVPNFRPAGEGMSFKSPLGEALKGLGDLVGTVTQGVDAIIKSNVTGDVETQVDPERKKMLGDLEATYGTQAVTQLLRPGERSSSTGAASEPTQTISGPEFPPPEISEIAPGGLTPGPKKLPKDINDLPGKINAIYNARNDGHISETYYWGRLSDIASDIRSRYPRGYRNYIDNKIQEITGRDPANAYIESLIRDINSNMGDKNKDRDKLIAEFYQGNLIGRPGAKETVKGLLSGAVTVDRGIDFLSALKRDDDIIEQAKKRYELDKSAKGFESDAAARYANTIAPKIVNQLFRGIQTANGPDVLDISTPEALNRLAAQYKSGKQTLDAKTAVFLATQVSAWEQAAEKALDEDFQKSGVYRDMANDPEKIKQIKALHLEPLKQLREAFSKGDVSAVANVTNLVKAAHDDFGYKMVNDKDLGYQGIVLRWLKENAGDQGAAVLLSRDPLRGLLNSFDQKTKVIMGQLMTPEGIGEKLGGKDYKSLVDSIEAIRKGAADNGLSVNHPQVIKSYDQLFQMIEEGLARPDIKPETRQALVKSIFSPENFKVLRNISPDRRDPYNPNIVVPGYQSLFYRLTRPEIAETVKKLGPEYQGLYMNWVQTAVRTDLFARDLVRLGEVLKQSTKAEDSLYSIRWNTTTKNFDIKTNPITNKDPTEGWQRLQRNTMPGLQDTIASLNKGLSGMANVAKGFGLEGTDVDGFVLDQLIQASVPGLDQVGQMPFKIGEAIKNAYAKEKFQAEQAKTKRKIQEEKYTRP